MHIMVRALLAASLGWASAAGAAWTGELLMPAASAGFVLGWAAPSSNLFLEYVPKGETVETWKRMVTVQRFPYRPGLTAEAVLRTMATGLAASCPGVTLSSIEPAPLGSQAGARMRSACPLNKESGQSETTFFRAIVGKDALHMVQAASRRSGSAEDRWAEQVIAGAVLCDYADRSARCEMMRSARLGEPL